MAFVAKAFSPTILVIKMRGVEFFRMKIPSAVDQMGAFWNPVFFYAQ